MALIVFDLLRDGDDDLRGLPLAERRARLEHVLLGLSRAPHLSPQRAGRRTTAAALTRGRKRRLGRPDRQGRALAAITPEAARPAWRKLKLLHEQEFVVGGWTEPRQTRQHFGALLLGVLRDGGELTYVGTLGTGFNEAELERVWSAEGARDLASPFSAAVKTNEPAHWVKPELVAQVQLHRVDRRRQAAPSGLPRSAGRQAPEDVRAKPSAQRCRSRSDGSPMEGRARSPTDPEGGTAVRASGTHAGHRISTASSISCRTSKTRGKDGAIELPDGDRCSVTNLASSFWPTLKITKGDLLRYYVEVVAAHPPVRRRSAAGDEALSERRRGTAFYQQRSREERPPRASGSRRCRDLEPIAEPDARGSSADR